MAAAEHTRLLAMPFLSLSGNFRIWMISSTELGRPDKKECAFVTCKYYVPTVPRPQPEAVPVSAFSAALGFVSVLLAMRMGMGH